MLCVTLAAKHQNMCYECCWCGTASEKINDFHARENGKKKTRNAGNFLCKGCSNLYLCLEWFKTVRDGSEDFVNKRRNWRILTALNLEDVLKDRQLGTRDI
jgi:hypothetical protein